MVQDEMIRSMWDQLFNRCGANMEKSVWDGDLICDMHIILGHVRYSCGNGFCLVTFHVEIVHSQLYPIYLIPTAT